MKLWIMLQWHGKNQLDVVKPPDIPEQLLALIHCL